MIRVEIGPLGDSRVFVGDEELEGVRSVHAVGEFGDLSRLFLELVAPEGIHIVMDPSLIFYGYRFEEDT